MQWQFSLDDSGVVKLLSVSDPADSVPHDDWSEEVRPGGNFCGVKYAAMWHAKVGVLEVSWERFVKWRDNR